MNNYLVLVSALVALPIAYFLMSATLRSLKPSSPPKMSPIPVALCGKNPSLASSFTKTMGPEYEVAHVFHSTSAVHSELPGLLRGKTMKPQSGLGANAESSQIQTPKAIIVGAGFSRDELEDMRGCEGGKTVPWLFPDPKKMALMPFYGPFFMTGIVSRAKKCMQKNGLVEGKQAEVVPDVWGF